ncbi:MAG: hypothetical protein DRP71_15395 [Verrucomicrobia bacterium]|nr:MAG: hypothetical protein DRP71_15395 [Verrucomicrobiota bacterium]
MPGDNKLKMISRKRHLNFPKSFRNVIIPGLLVVGSLLTTWEARGAWIPVGDASAPDGAGYVQITPPQNNQVGAVWLDVPLDLSLNFDMTLLVNLGDRDANGADGFSIVFQNDPRGTAAIGDNAAGGEWVGMHNIIPALAIELDTYQNGSRGDPGCDHLGINEFTGPASVPDHSGAAPVCATSSSANIEDGLDHVVRLVWDSSAPLLTVYFDGQQVLTYAKDIRSILGGGNNAYFGVVGSTGGAFNDQRFKAIIPTSEILVTNTVAPTAVDPGDLVTYSVTIQNISTSTAFANEFEDLLPAGFTYVTGSASGLTSVDPSIVGQALTWGDNWLIAPGSTATLVFQATASVTPGIYFNNITARGTNFADASTGNTAMVTVGSDLSTSTKGVVDLNGGDLEPGDTLQYTVTLVETAGRLATGVSLVDDLQTDLANPSLVSPLPAGAVDNSTPAQVNLTNLTVPASGNLNIVFQVTVMAGTTHGTAIDNTANIVNGAGLGANPVAPTLTVVNPAFPITGSKPLYMHDNFDLSRLAITAPQTELRINGGQDVTWTLNPSATLPITIDGGAGTIPVTMWIRGGRRRIATLTLTSSAGVIGTLGPLNINANNYGTAPATFNIPITNAGALVDISSLQLNVDNVSARRNRRIRIQPYFNGIPSRVDLESLTVIRVESVLFYDAPYPGGSVITSTAGGGTVYARAVVSDPFGSFDISSAALTMTTPSGTAVVTSAPMTEVAADANGPRKIYELAYPSPPAAWPTPTENGSWTVRVTAEEGTEGLVRHTRMSTLQVGSSPDILLVMSVQSHSDPINGTANPFSLPGAAMTYTVAASNHGGPGLISDTIVITDPIPPNTAFCLDDLGQPWGPVAFMENMPPSGLSLDPANDVTFSMDGGNNFNLTIADLVPDATGCDPRITHLRVHPKGTIAGVNGAGVPGFTILFRAQVR